MEHIEKIEQKIYVRYAFEFSHKLMTLDLGKARKYHLPELVNRFLEVSALQKPPEIAHRPACSIGANFIWYPLLSFYHPLFLGFGLIMFIIVLLILRFTAAQGLASAVDTSDAKYALTSWFEDLSHPFLILRQKRYDDWHMHQTDYLVGQYLKHRTRHFVVLKFQYWSLIIFKISIIAIMLILGVFLLVDQQINIGQFIAADLVIIAIINSVEKFIGNFDKVYNALVALENSKNWSCLPEAHPGSFQRQFADLPRQFLSNHLTMQKVAGSWKQVPGLVGSPHRLPFTKMPLITGLIDPIEGHARIDGLPSTSFVPAQLRKIQAGWVKPVACFEGSILENITMGNEPSEPAQLMQLAHLTGLMKAIQKFKNGFDTQLGPRDTRQMHL